MECIVQQPRYLRAFMKLFFLKHVIFFTLRRFNNRVEGNKRFPCLEMFPANLLKIRDTGSQGTRAFPLVSKLEDNSRGCTAILDELKFSSSFGQVFSIYLSSSPSFALSPFPLVIVGISFLPIIQMDCELQDLKTMEAKRCLNSWNWPKWENGRILAGKHPWRLTKFFLKFQKFPDN